MNNGYELIVKKLTSENKVIKIKPNSVFSGLDAFSNKEEMINPIVKALSVKLLGQISLMRNKIKIFMEDFEDAVTEKVKEYSPPSELSKYNIEVLNIPTAVDALKSNNILVDSRSPIPLPNDTFNLEAPADLVRYAQHTNNEVNTYVQMIISKEDSDYLNKLWDKYLSNISSSNLNISNMGVNVMLKLEDYVVLYVILDNLKTTKPDNCTIPDTAYFGRINHFQSEVANYLAMGSTLFNNGRTTRKLVIAIPDQYTVLVDEEMYNKFLQEGGSSEAVLGILLDPPGQLPNKYTVDYMLDSKEMYKNMWEQRANLIRYKEVDNNLNRYRVCYSMVLSDINKNIPGSVRDLIKMDQDEINNKLPEFLNTLDKSVLCDVTLASREIIGRFLLPDTKFYSYTGSMLDYKKLNPELEPNEAASYATIDLILDYLLDQIELGE